MLIYKYKKRIEFEENNRIQGDGRGSSTTSQERQKPRHEHPKPNQERLELREERLGQRGGASSSRWRASRPMKGESRTKLLSP